MLVARDDPATRAARTRRQREQVRVAELAAPRRAGLARRERRLRSEHGHRVRDRERRREQRRSCGSPTTRRSAVMRDCRWYGPRQVRARVLLLGRLASSLCSLAVCSRRSGRAPRAGQVLDRARLAARAAASIPQLEKIEALQEAAVRQLHQEEPAQARRRAARGRARRARSSCPTAASCGSRCSSAPGWPLPRERLDQPPGQAGLPAADDRGRGAGRSVLRGRAEVTRAAR